MNEYAIITRKSNAIKNSLKSKIDQILNLVLFKLNLPKQQKNFFFFKLKTD